MDIQQKEPRWFNKIFTPKKPKWEEQFERCFGKNRTLDGVHDDTMKSFIRQIIKDEKENIS